MFVPFSANILAFYRQNPNHQDPGEIGGANAPPNSPTKQRKRGLGRGKCRHLATPCWWVALVYPSDFIWSWIFSLSPGA